MSFRYTYEQLYENNPILLVKGAAGPTSIPVPLTLLMGAAGSATSFLQGLLRGNVSFSYEGPKCTMAPNAELVSSVPALYPTIDPFVAANTMIDQPLRFAMNMAYPASAETPMPTKIAIFSATKALLDKHRALGGTFTVLTGSSGILENCMMTSFRDTTPGGTQPQWLWTIEFIQPKVSANTLLDKALGGIANAAAKGIQKITGEGDSLLKSLKGSFGGGGI